MRRVQLILLLCCSLPSLVLAQNSGNDLSSTCQFGDEDQYLPASNVDPKTKPTNIDADTGLFVKGGTSVFTGNVQMQRANQRVTSDKATYNQNNGEMTAKGDVLIRDSEMVIKTDQAEWSKQKNKGVMTPAEYHLRESHARGNADKVVRYGKEKTDLVNATYTTCPDTSNAWILKATTVNLDHKDEVGKAWNVILKVKDVPVFYLPYISFPLSDERKSGFLPPTIGYGNDPGFELSTPYYWNIAPNYDATITPHYMEERGLMMENEFRYLTQGFGEGELHLNYLGADQLQDNKGVENPFYNKERYLFSWKHSGNFTPSWYSKVDYNNASDRYYVRDFGTSLSLSSDTYLNRLFETGYRGEIWDFTAKVKDYQPLLLTTAPYQVLPQLQLSATLPDQAYGLSYQFNTEYTDFKHDTLVNGQRLATQGAISLPLEDIWYFVKPRLALTNRQYIIGANNNGSYSDDTNVTLPIASLDSGLYFDRDLSFAGGSYTQTLEPRAFYLYVPYEKQTGIPLFDSALSSFDMTQLFTYNRFSGGDRIGDANQLSLAMTSRIINEQGDEKLSFTVGQIQYFKDREVRLNTAQQIDTRSTSDIVTEAKAYINSEWTADGQMQLDPSGLSSNLSSVSLRYRGSEGALFNATQRYRRKGSDVTNPDPVNQLDISGVIPVNNKWSVLGRWYHSFEQGRDLESLLGVQYDSCCWMTRFVVRDYVNNQTLTGIGEERHRAFFIQFQLKGLGSFGSSPDALIGSSIPGYHSDWK